MVRKNLKRKWLIGFELCFIRSTISKSAFEEPIEASISPLVPL